MNRWKIVHSESSRGWGGQEHRILAELCGFRRRQSQGWLLAPGDAGVLARAQDLGISTRALNVGRLQFPLSVMNTARWLRQISPDIVNTHSSRDGWIVGLAARLAKVPLVLRSRHFHVPIPSPKVSRIAYGSLADHVLTTSQQISEQLRSTLALSPDFISTIPTGVDVSVFSPIGLRADLRPSGSRTSVPLIGMISVLRQAKGYGTLLQAASLLKQSGFRAHYVIVGEGPQRSTIEEQVRQLDLADEVQLTGHREDIPEILRSLDLLAIPSLSEGVPQIALQAMATKTPVVGSDVGGIPEVIRQGQTGRIFPAGDARAMAETIREAFQDTAATRQFADQGRLAVEANHTIDVMLDKLEAVYCLYVRPSSGRNDLAANQPAHASQPAR